MKRFMFVWIVVAGLAVIASGTAAAQGRRGGRGAGWGPGGQYGRMFDPKTVETVSGKVTLVEKIVPMRGMGQGVHMTVQTASGSIHVHLGPSWFIDHQDYQVQAGDEVEIKGSRIMFQGQPALIAMEVKRGEMVLRLRDDNGFPFWSGWRNR